MNKVALAFSTKDRVELTRQSIEPLLQPDKFDLFWMDGSDSEAGKTLWREYESGRSAFSIHCNIRGGADAAIVYGLTTLLDHPNNYDYVGLVENDVLLHSDWFGPTMALFERGRADGLDVGAVSARAYEDRILCQRDGYALMHNIGAGMIIFTRLAAQFVLANFRTGYWPDNRSIFAQLTDLDIGRWACFRDNEQHVTSDWHFEVTLAQHGLAALALTPSPCQMIGQVPPLAQQGLKLVDRPVELLRNDVAFALFSATTRQIRNGEWRPGYHRDERLQFSDGVYTIYPHQFGRLGARWEGDWLLKWSQGFGPFAWKADQSFTDQQPTLTLPIIGACELLVGGGENGGKVEIKDEASGYVLRPTLLPDTSGQVMNLQVPAVMRVRNVVLTALSLGIVVYGLRTRQLQPAYDGCDFDHGYLPPP